MIRRKDSGKSAGAKVPVMKKNITAREFVELSPEKQDEILQNMSKEEIDNLEKSFAKYQNFIRAKAEHLACRKSQKND